MQASKLMKCPAERKLNSAATGVDAVLTASVQRKEQADYQTSSKGCHF
jgi:hypothetical protein